MAEECLSCKANITNGKGTVKFLCPKCSKYEIIRCKKCREIIAKYICPECGFTGPN
ncbi:MAG: zinc finger domain-containing protein [Nanoarchaeota archaeon]|nr:RNA-binding protein [Nanoarchaeota archaeon]MBU1030497.1 RNA-binding protein [Nanoarchaeota archaeon]